MSTLAKYGKIGSLVSLLGAGGAAGYGYAGPDRGIEKREFVLQARSGKVWELLSEPENTARWLPKEILDIERVQTVGPKGMEKLADFFGAAKEPTPTAGDPTHIFHLRDGRQLKFRVALEEDDKVRRETVVLKEGKFGKHVASAEWGFEVERTEESRRETKLTVTRKLRFERPVGVLLELWNRVSGKRKQQDAAIFEGIERATRDL